MNNTTLNTLFPDHKLLYEFNNKSTSLKEPEWIFFGERHRPDYDPESDRKANIAASNLLLKNNQTIFVEAPSTETLSSSSHPQTKNLKVEKMVYGCMNAKAFDEIKKIQEFIGAGFQLIMSDNFSTNAWESFLKDNWNQSWSEVKLPPPAHQEVSTEIVRRNAFHFLNHVWEFRNKKIGHAHLLHTYALINALKTHSEASGIITYIGKNHLYIGKELSEALKLKFLENGKKDEMEESIQLLHDYLQKSEKWCVILKPIKKSEDRTTSV